jgi:predicted flap endonuclease-1-like 5' DNA nuclease
MTALLWETALLLLAAYFLGAWVACIIRRTFFADVGSVRSDETQDQLAGEAPAVAPGPMPLPAAPVAADASGRVDHIRANQGLSTGPGVSASAGASVQRSTAGPARAAASAAAVPPASPPQPAPVPGPTATHAGASAAAANTRASLTRSQVQAGATPTAEQRTRAAASAKAADLPATPASGIAPRPPVASPPRLSASVSTGAAAKVIQPSATQAADDLTRIQGIDPGLQVRLGQLGVQRFADIANWRAADIARISAALGFNRRIERENWIEQAQILASGGETFFSSQKRRGALVMDQPPPDPAEAKRPRGASPSVTPHADAAAAGPARPPLAPSGAADTAAPRKSATSLARENLPPPTRLVDAISTVAGKSESDTARAAHVDVATHGAAELAILSGAATVDIGTATTVPRDMTAAGAGRGLRREDLKRIRGIGVLLESKLNEMGITSYEQIANWSKSDIDRISQALDVKGRIEREKWVEQALTLSSGGQTEFSRRIDRGEIGGNPSKT